MLVLFAMAAEHNLYTTDSIERGRQFCMFSRIFPFFGRHVITHCLRDKDIKPLLKLALIAFVTQCFRLFQNTLKNSAGKPSSPGLLLCPPPWGVDILFLLFSPSDVRRPMSGVTHGFRSFKGKVLELLSPNLVCRLIGSVACLGLLLAVVPLLLTE